MDGLTPEMRRFIEEAKASGMTRCPIRDIEEKVDKCPVDLKTIDARGRKQPSSVHARSALEPVGAKRETDVKPHVDERRAPRPAELGRPLRTDAAAGRRRSCRTSSPGT